MKVTVYAADMPFKTAHFNKGQRVWLMRISGDAAANSPRLEVRSEHIGQSCCSDVPAGRFHSSATAAPMLAVVVSAGGGNMSAIVALFRVDEL